MHSLLSVHILNFQPQITLCHQLRLVSSDHNNNRKWQELMNDKNLLCNCKQTANHCCLASCLTSQCVTLDGAAIIQQAAHTLTDTVQWPLSSPCPLHAEHKKHSWLLRLSSSLHNDFAACIWLFPCSMSLRNKQLKKVRKRKKTYYDMLTMSCLLFCSICIFAWVSETRTLGPQRVRRVPSLAAEVHYSLKQKDCGGIHLILSIVWQ